MSRPEEGKSWEKVEKEQLKRWEGNLETNLSEQRMNS